MLPLQSTPRWHAREQAIDPRKLVAIWDGRRKRVSFLVFRKSLYQIFRNHCPRVTWEGQAPCVTREPRSLENGFVELFQVVGGDLGCLEEVHLRHLFTRQDIEGGLEGRFRVIDR